jgi:hypothetical protein
MPKRPVKHHPKQLWLDFTKPKPKGQSTVNAYYNLITFIVEHNIRILRNWTEPLHKWSKQQRTIAHDNLFQKQGKQYITDYDIIPAAYTMVHNWQAFTDAYPLALPIDSIHDKARQLWQQARKNIDTYRALHSLYPIPWDILIQSYPHKTMD